MSVGTTTVGVVETLSQTRDVAEPRARRGRGRFLNPLLILGFAIVGLAALFVLVYPMISPYSPTEPDFTQPTFAGPSWSHPLGTDNFGRDTLTRLAYGGRIDLVIAFAATSITLIVGGALGLASGYFGGWFDSLLMRLVDFTLTMPYLVLVIAIVAVLGTGTWNIVYAIWLVGWVAYTRIIRAETLVARQLEYVEAARVIGMSQPRIMFRHILPNVVSAALIFAMADMVLNILVSTSLSFLGLGVQPPNPEWGLMVAEARDFFLRDWRLMTYPGLAVLIVGAGFGLIGDGLAQALRPRG
ncbi:MAG: ABC transporter permease [Chloroflexota bacterium]|nr:ABC transporter permease [Chloroflexia bacterium]MDQ3226364.1 ABC transporter permease [Chloroflexota bacterium]